MKESNYPESPLTHQQRIELELLHSVLDSDAPYPWNPCSPSSDAYLGQLDEISESEEWSEDTFESKWNQVSAIAQQFWSEPSSSLGFVLGEKFGARMPAHLLNQLTERVQEIAGNGQSLIDQLVASAQTILDGWETGDLYVMARPLAMSMRGGQDEILEVTLKSVQQTDWENLPEIEKARLSLAIARYALRELSQSE